MKNKHMLAVLSAIIAASSLLASCASNSGIEAPPPLSTETTVPDDTVYEETSPEYNNEQADSETGYEDAPSAPEYVFVPDYEPGNEKTMSVYNPCFGFFRPENLSVGNNTALVWQDKMIYFYNPLGYLCKVPVGGSADDVICLYDMKELGYQLGQSVFNVYDFQIIGDWIYVLFDSCITRVRTDGMEAQPLVTDMYRTESTLFRGDAGEFIVRDGKLYYATQEKTQVSASEDTCSCFIICYDLETGVAEPIFRDDADNCCCFIRAYTQSTMLILSYHDGYESNLVYDFEQQTYTPLYTSAYPRDEIAADESCYYYYHNKSHGKDILYRYAPENNFAEEEYAFEGEDHIGDKFFANESGLYTSGWGVGLWRCQDGGFVRVNGDEASSVYYCGDDYIYYYNNSSGKYTLNRVHPDGSGWEPLDWDAVKIEPYR